LPLLDAFRQGLVALGYAEGRTIVVEPRFAEGDYTRFPAIFAELLQLKVDILAVTGAVTARAAKQVGATTPIVFTIVVDPVADQVVPNLEHPGGAVTGVTSFDPQQATKQLTLFKQVVPSLTKVAILGDQGVSAALITASEQQARALGLHPQPIRLTGPNPDLDATFAAIRQQQADGLLVLEKPVLGVHAKRIADLAAQDRLPTLFPPSRVAAGGLLSYGTSQMAGIQRMAAYVDKILKGAQPGDLPVETVNRYELIVNLATARALGVTVPPAVLQRADRVIQ
jgi:putative tryptophan/tyrosine transport system substrate-binding protein